MPTLRQPIATWSPERDCWETGQGDLLSGLSDVFSETWPRSGSMRSGMAYAHPTLEHPMGGSGSSLLPTPEAKNSHAGQDYARAEREGSGGDDLVTALLKQSR